MGAGKTQSAISLMNDDASGNYIFVTPYLAEVERIKESCSERKFYSPENFGDGKLENLHKLLGRGQNVASTHALFSTYTPYTADLIHNGEYTLILDEVFCVVETIDLKGDDFNILMNSALIEIEDDGERVRWVKEDYDGTKFHDIMLKAKSHTLILFNGQLLFWSFPVEIFKSFKRVIVLTYMFDAQIQKNYFDIYGIKTVKIGARRNGDRYEFCAAEDGVRYISDLKKKIKIVDDEKLNRIGDSDYSLSSAWYRRADKAKEKPLLVALKKNVYNFFYNRCSARAGDVLWTTFKKYRVTLRGKGYSNGFLACNMRATNEYRDRKYLAYCINMYLNPVLTNYFASHGCAIDEDRYALSEMIQWIWRSAIRDGKEVVVYVPSKRMRGLLLNWIEEVS